MVPHDILTLYTAKAIEYLLAVIFLVTFVPFWRYVNGGVARARAAARESLTNVVTSWFRVPADAYFHPGHAWARVGADGLVTVGMDDFAQKLVGPLRGLQLPAVGARLAQGEPGWAVKADSKAVDMLAPVGGVVVSVNSEVLEEPGSVNRDPYGDGWLMRLRAPRLAAHLATLRSGEVARRWMDEVCESLSTSLTPGLGKVYQDGGLPVDGLAHALAGDDWDRLARRFLLTETSTRTDARESEDSPGLKNVVAR